MPKRLTSSLHFWVGSDSRCPPLFVRKRASNGIVAIKALAHKLARACYFMLREHKPFEAARCFVQTVVRWERAQYCGWRKTTALVGPSLCPPTVHG
jgi:hypothetical protein